MRHLVRAFAPSVPAVAAVLLVRALGPSERDLGIAFGELVLYLGVTVLATALYERRLLLEVLGYLLPVRPGADGLLARVPGLMSRRGTTMLLTLIGVGVAGQLALAFGFYGYAYDIDSMSIVRLFFENEGFSMYGFVNAVEPVVRWPYPPGFIPAIFGADWVAGNSPLPFHGVVQIPAIVAGAALAFLVQWYLGTRGASESTRLVAAGLIALGPVFLLISGYHGQIDAVAILPAVAALIVWERGGSRRAVWAGLLLGTGAAIKIVPAFMLLAFLPHLRNLREGATLVGLTAAVPGVLLAPFLIADPEGVKTLVEYAGAPGQGGLSLALQPGLASFYIEGEPFALNPMVDFLYDNGWINALVLAVLGLALLRFRPPLLTGAILVWMTLWVFSTAFFFHYLIWGLPFLIMAGFLRLAAAIQIAAVAPALLFYTEPWGHWAMWVYVPIMLSLWIGIAVAAVGIARSAGRSNPAMAS